MPTKSQVKNTRWMLMEQRVEFLEEKITKDLVAINEKIHELKTNEIAHLNVTIADLNKSFCIRRDQVDAKLEALQKVIYKAVGAVGAILTIVNILLKVLK